MNKLIATAASVVLVNLSALAQGSILLQNLGSGFTNAAVKDPNGVLVAAGSSQYTIELLGGTSATSVTPFVTPITTTTWWGLGYFGVGDPERVLPFVPGSFPFFQLRAWNNTGGITSYDVALAVGQAYLPGPVFQLIPTGVYWWGLGNPAASPPVPAPPLVGMPSGWELVVVPEPSTVVLGVLGAAALLLRRHSTGSFNP